MQIELSANYTCMTNHYKIQGLKSTKLHLFLVLQFGCSHLDSSSLLSVLSTELAQHWLGESIPKLSLSGGLAKLLLANWEGPQREPLWGPSLSLLVTHFTKLPGPSYSMPSLCIIQSYSMSKSNYRCSHIPGQYENKKTEKKKEKLTS